MASELYVETLKGLTSGANANKVIVPAGQTLEVVDGLRSADMPAGSVLQVVQGLKTDTFSTSSTSFVDVTGLSVSITPSSSSSRFLILGSITGHGRDGVFSANPQLVRDTTPIFTATGAGSRTLALSMLETTTGSMETIPIAFVDEPSTTSSITYKIRLRVNNGSYNGLINKGGTDSDSAIYTRAASSIIVMEIAG